MSETLVVRASGYHMQELADWSVYNALISTYARALRARVAKSLLPPYMKGIRLVGRLVHEGELQLRVARSRLHQ